MPRQPWRFILFLLAAFFTPVYFLSGPYYMLVLIDGSWDGLFALYATLFYPFLTLVCLRLARRMWRNE